MLCALCHSRDSGRWKIDRHISKGFWKNAEKMFLDSRFSSTWSFNHSLLTKNSWTRSYLRTFFRAVVPFADADPPDIRKFPENTSTKLDYRSYFESFKVNSALFITHTRARPRISANLPRLETQSQSSKVVIWTFNLGSSTEPALSCLASRRCHLSEYILSQFRTIPTLSSRRAPIRQRSRLFQTRRGKISEPSRPLWRLATGALIQLSYCLRGPPSEMEIGL